MAETVPPEGLADGLAGGLAQLGVPADAAQCERLHAWLRLLERWNSAFNLTAVPAGERVAKLVLTSAAAIPHLQTGSLLDVGSGAGVPGIPLAILMPGSDCTLIDSSGKKTRFLEQCRLELGLDNVQVVRARVEAFDRAAFDTIVARAFARLDIFFGATRHLAHADTRWLTFKGAAVADEVQHLPPDRAKWQLHRLQVPGLEQPVSLVALQERKAGG